MAGETIGANVTFSFRSIAEFCIYLLKILHIFFFGNFKKPKFISINITLILAKTILIPSLSFFLSFFLSLSLYIYIEKNFQPIFLYNEPKLGMWKPFMFATRRNIGGDNYEITNDKGINFA